MRIFAIFTVLFLSVTGISNAKVLDINVVTSNKGLSAWYVEDKTVPVISLSFSFQGSMFYNDADKSGLAYLTSILLDEGAGDLTSQEFQRQLADNAIELSFTAGRDAFHGHLKTTVDNKAKAFDLLKMALTKPRFDEDAILRMKQSTISQIKNNIGNPNWVSARTFNGMLFGDHFYSRPGQGTIKSIENITREDLIAFTKKQFSIQDPAKSFFEGMQKLNISIAGDINKEEASKLVDLIFADLSFTNEVIKMPNAELQNKGKTILYELDTPQSFISVGHSALKRDDKDWYALTIANYILGGGGFSSRLMHEIREKKGLTYGVYSSMNNMNSADIIQASLSTSNENAAEALGILKTEWNKFAENGVTIKELSDAKSYITGSILLGLTSTSQISNAMNSIQRDNLGIDYINNRNDLINAVTLEDIKRVSKDILKSEDFMTVIVGKPVGIEADIKLDKLPKMDQ